MPTEVVIDWITDNVYFIDKSVAIKVCHIEKRNCIALIGLKQGEHIKTVAVDAFRHRLFYATLKKKSNSPIDRVQLLRTIWTTVNGMLWPSARFSSRQ